MRQRLPGEERKPCARDLPCGRRVSEHAASPEDLTGCRLPTRIEWIRTQRREPAGLDESSESFDNSVEMQTQSSITFSGRENIFLCKVSLMHYYC